MMRTIEMSRTCFKTFFFRVKHYCGLYANIDTLFEYWLTKFGARLNAIYMYIAVSFSKHETNANDCVTFLLWKRWKSLSEHFDLYLKSLPDTESIAIEKIVSHCQNDGVKILHCWQITINKTAMTKEDKGILAVHIAVNWIPDVFHLNISIFILHLLYIKCYIQYWT